MLWILEKFSKKQTAAFGLRFAFGSDQFSFSPGERCKNS
jgi:hypothetical protein